MSNPTPTPLEALVAEWVVKGAELRAAQTQQREGEAFLDQMDPAWRDRIHNGYEPVTPDPRTKPQETQ